MLASFRRLSKSRIGTVVLIAFLLAIVASFAVADISNVASGGFSSRGTVAKVGSQELTETDLSKVMDRQLSRTRQQNPEARMADLVGSVDSVVHGLLQEMAIAAFADDNGIVLSRRLVDAQIAELPAARGLDGRFSEQSYAAFLQQQRMTDAEVRREIGNALLQRLVLAPVGANTRIGRGIAQPFATMLLEQREGEIAAVAVDRFRAGLEPTDSDLQAFYAANRGRYLVPEQRTIRYARIGPEQVATVAASEQEIAADYASRQADYAGKQTRLLSQAVVPDQKVAAAIAERARGGSDFAAAAAPAGLGAADVALGEQTRAELASVAGEAVAAAVFAARAGQVVGPIQSELGWHVLKIDSVRDQPARPLAAVRDEIAQRLTADKRKEALIDLVTAVEDAIADGASFAEVTAKHRLAAVETPPVTARGTAPGQPGYTLPAEAAPLVKPVFDLAPDEDGHVETLADGSFALVAVGRVIPAAAPPLAQVRQQVRSDWITRRARDRARQVAEAIAARVERGVPLAAAVRAAGTPLPAPQPVTARRLQLAQFGNRIPPPLAVLFRLPVGKARMVAAPDGFYIVRVNRVVPGDSAQQPELVARTQAEFGQLAGREYAEQFIAAIQSELDVSRDETAIDRVKQQLAGTGG